MEPLYLEIIVDQHELAKAGLGRDALEDPLEAAMDDSKLGMVTGGGSGSKTAMIEVELFDAEKLGEGLALIRRTLIDCRAPASTVIKQLEPDVHLFALHG